MFYFLLTFFVGFVAANNKPETCPQGKYLDNFYLTNLEHKRYYEIARYSNFELERNADCVYYDFTLDTAEQKLNYSANEIKDGSIVILNGSMIPVPGFEGKGKFEDDVYFGASGIHLQHDIVFNSDYKTVMMYSCSINKQTGQKNDIAWIFSVNKTLDSDVKAALDNFIKNSDFLDFDIFFWDHFTLDACKNNLF